MADRQLPSLNTVIGKNKKEENERIDKRLGGEGKRLKKKEGKKGVESANKDRGEREVSS